MKFEDLKPEDIKLIKDSMLENSVNLIANCQGCKSSIPIDSFYNDMEMAHRLIYLTNVLNDVRKYADMKFYEFNDFEYYALIGAISEAEAIKYYEENIAEIIKEDDGEPDEITKDEAKEKLLKICKDEQQKFKEIEEFTECVNQNDPYLILIDGSLI